MKSHYSAEELAQMSLPGLPKTSRNIRERAKKEGWLTQKRKGVGGGFVYEINCLPKQAQDVLREKIYQSVLAEKPKEIESMTTRVKRSKPRSELEILRQCPALLDREVGKLTAQQKQIADARAALSMEVERLRDHGMSRTAAVHYIATASRNGTLPAHLKTSAELANARKGGRIGVGERSLQEWLSVFESTNPGIERMTMLAPGYLKAKKPEQIKWLPDFLAHWRNLNGPCLREAYAKFSTEWERIYNDQPAMIDARPSYDAVRRAMAKLPRRERVRGRVTGSAVLAYEIYQKRDWSQMPVNGCWITDGKSLDMKVAHPIHGRPFTPELTLVLDGRTRYCVGWSLALSENVVAVADAYRHAMKHHGKPLIAYSDNGGGEANKTFDAEITGIFGRVGIDHPTSIPGRAQSRGLIERLNKVIPRRIAMEFETFNGSSADRENLRITERQIKSAINAVDKGYELSPVQRNALRMLPSWQRLLDVISEEVEKYNHQHEHSELPKYNGRHLTPAAYRKMVLEQEGDEIEYLTDVELNEMFMPEEIRVAQRGWLSLLNNDYFSKDLTMVDGEKVRVAFDIHDASEVIVRKMDGTFVCKAIYNGNKVAAQPISKVEALKQQRTQRRLKRLDDMRDEVHAEARPLLGGNTLPDFGAFMPPEPKIDDEPFFFLETDRDEYLKKNGGRR
ncbi:DDE-type integrase/transposase/recombinase [Martelella alba]|uniref:DDE-type integrase/transposase/recombinase n=2 Tax=Martelella alba TaxID=2590451 RepID=A0ABY2SRS8_9HYPH|nr:DDE-type integrase/transposase/recombinase [Martelella alba]